MATSTKSVMVIGLEISKLISTKKSLVSKELIPMLGRDLVIVTPLSLLGKTVYSTSLRFSARTS